MSIKEIKEIIDRMTSLEDTLSHLTGLLGCKTAKSLAREVESLIEKNILLESQLKEVSDSLGCQNQLGGKAGILKAIEKRDNRVTELEEQTSTVAKAHGYSSWGKAYHFLSNNVSVEVPDLWLINFPNTPRSTLVTLCKEIISLIKDSVRLSEGEATLEEGLKWLRGTESPEEAKAFILGYIKDKVIPFDAKAAVRGQLGGLVSKEVLDLLLEDAEGVFSSEEEFSGKPTSNFLRLVGHRLGMELLDARDWLKRGGIVVENPEVEDLDTELVYLIPNNSRFCSTLREGVNGSGVS